VQHIPRAAWAAVTAALRDEAGHVRDPVAAARRLWPDDEVSPLLLTRAATTGATTTVSGWASQLLTRQVAEWLGSLGPASAAARLIASGITVPVTDGVPLGVPYRATAPASAPFVDEGGAIPMRAWSFGTSDLNPRKLGILVVLTRELARYSGAQAIFEAMLAEEAAMGLDAAYFGTQASSSSTHAGLLNGLVAGTGSAVMANDLAALAEAAGANGSGNVVYVMGPGRAAAATVRMPAEATATVLPSLACPENRVICIDTKALVHGFGPDPEILASEEALLHMESVPLQIATGAQGSGVLATPTQSMYQTSTIAMRMILTVAFCKRRTGCVAYADGATW
jgi:hypothetical protein